MSWSLAKVKKGSNQDEKKIRGCLQQAEKELGDQGNYDAKILMVNRAWWIMWSCARKAEKFKYNPKIQAKCIAHTPEPPKQDIIKKRLSNKQIDRQFKYMNWYMSTYLTKQQPNYSPAKRNPTNSKSSSLPGGGKWARMQLTAQDGRTTGISFPTTSQHHRTSRRHETWREFFLLRLSYAVLPYCCLYCSQAACRTHLFKQTVRKPGLSVIQLYMAELALCIP